MAARKRGSTVGAFALLMLAAALLAPVAASGSADPGVPRAQAYAPAQATTTATPTRTATATASPAAPRTGQAGLVDKSSNSGAAILFVAIAVAVVAGGRLLTSRDR